MVTQEQFDEAVLNVTSGPDWEIVKKGLANDIYNTQAGVFDNARDWGSFMEFKGFARGIAYVINLRETVIRTLENEKTNANL